MILLQGIGDSGDPMDRWVVYHTGPHGDAEGIVKKLRLSDLARHPNRRWHPVESNPYFLGVYRWKFLDDNPPQ